MVAAPAGTMATWLNAGLATSPAGCMRVISMTPMVSPNGSLSLLAGAPRAMSPVGRTRLSGIATFTTVDDYIASHPPDVRGALQQIRRTIHAVVPGARETISYNIPTITL